MALLFQARSASSGHPVGLLDIRDIQQIPQDIHEAPRSGRAFAVHGVFEQGLPRERDHGDLRILAADVDQEPEIPVDGRAPPRFEIGHVRLEQPEGAQDMRLVFDHRNDAVAEVGIDGLEDLPDLVAAAPGEAPVLHGQSLHPRLAEGGEERANRLQGVSLVGDARPVEDRARQGRRRWPSWPCWNRCPAQC